MNISRLTIYPRGGVKFSAYLDEDFLGFFEFGSINGNGQYEQTVEEIINAAREEWCIDPSVDASVR